MYQNGLLKILNWNDYNNLSSTITNVSNSSLVAVIENETKYVSTDTTALIPENQNNQPIKVATISQLHNFQANGLIPILSFAKITKSFDDNLRMTLYNQSTYEGNFLSYIYVDNISANTVPFGYVSGNSNTSYRIPAISLNYFGSILSNNFLYYNFNINSNSMRYETTTYNHDISLYVACTNASNNPNINIRVVMPSTPIQIQIVTICIKIT